MLTVVIGCCSLWVERMLPIVIVVVVGSMLFKLMMRLLLYGVVIVLGWCCSYVTRCYALFHLVSSCFMMLFYTSL